VQVCVVNGRANDSTCSQTLVEWLKPDEMPKMAVLAPATDADLKSSPINAVVGRGETAPLANAVASQQIHLSISTPSRNSQIWRNPEQPAAFDRLALKADVEPHVPQIVWYVDGQPFAVTDPDRPVFWPIQNGEHRFQIRLPYRDETSSVVPVYVQ
jgi:penicillin-binding protein 1C